MEGGGGGEIGYGDGVGSGCGFRCHGTAEGLRNEVVQGEESARGRGRRLAVWNVRFVRTSASPCIGDHNQFRGIYVATIIHIQLGIFIHYYIAIVYI